MIELTSMNDKMRTDIRSKELQKQQDECQKTQTQTVDDEHVLTKEELNSLTPRVLKGLFIRSTYGPENSRDPRLSKLFTSIDDESEKSKEMWIDTLISRNTKWTNLNFEEQKCIRFISN